LANDNFEISSFECKKQVLVKYNLVKIGNKYGTFSCKNFLGMFETSREKNEVKEIRKFIIL